MQVLFLGLWYQVVSIQINNDSTIYNVQFIHPKDGLMIITIDRNEFVNRVTCSLT
jgi:hypothetical protein